MGFLGDLKEVQEGWKEKSWGYKALVIISIFFTTSSLTGLAGLIIQWRGFIKDGIDFYHEWIIGPIRKVLNFLTLELPIESIDLWTLITLVFLPMISIDRYLGNGAGVRFYIMCYAVIVLAILLEAIDITNLVIIGFISAMSLILLYFMLISRNSDIKLIILRPIVAVLIVLLLAAINKGLQAPI